jgi:small subunit ribosomal protein S17
MTKEVKVLDKKEIASTTAINRKLSGVITSDKMDKTIVVKVETTKVHPKYGKRYVETAKYKAHDEKNEHKIGEKVTIVACRPISKDKRWRVVSQ